MRKILLSLLLGSALVLHWSPYAYSQNRLTARLDSLIHTYPANTPGFALSIEKKGDIIYRNAIGCSATDPTGTPLDTRL